MYADLESLKTVITKEWDLGGYDGDFGVSNHNMYKITSDDLYLEPISLARICFLTRTIDTGPAPDSSDDEDFLYADSSSVSA